MILKILPRQLPEDLAQAALYFLEVRPPLWVLIPAAFYECIHLRCKEPEIQIRRSASRLDTICSDDKHTTHTMYSIQIDIIVHGETARVCS